MSPTKRLPGAARAAARAAQPAEPKTGPSAIPERIFGQASTRSVGGVSLFEAQSQIAASTVGNFFSDSDVTTRAVLRLQDAGFEVLQVTPVTINIAGSRETYQQAFNTSIVAQERPVIKERGEETTATFLDSPDTELPGLIATAGTRFEDVLEGVALEEPRYYLASMYAPLKAYWHLRIPGDVSLGCNADRAHRGGTTGAGIKVVMVDSGHFAHPYFAGRGYRVAPVVLGPGAANPLADEIGHGTGESCNILSVAPDVDFTMVKLNFVNATAAFNAGVALAPQVISLSWGSDKPVGPLSAADQALAAAIATAVANGIIVICSAGNGQFSFPGQHPDVISAGGVYMNIDESLQASNYASGFMSTIYPNRRVPDLCGLVGLLPHASYIMLPVQPSDQIDTQFAGGAFPNADETAADDGWAAFSGTSAAAPQLAGVAALIKQACLHLTPAEVKDIMMSTARDVTAGTCNARTGGFSAVPGPDQATGNGLVNAHSAVMVAKVRCLGPIGPRQPIQPVQPTQPIQPTQPRQPVQPVQPVQPRQPVQPTQPTQPVQPTQPAPRQPVQPRPPEPPVGPGGPLSSEAGPAPGLLSADDVKALEEMIRKGSLNL